MLQIISGKFFDSEDLYHTECRAILYSNASFKGRHIFSHIVVESAEQSNDTAAYIISYDNKIQLFNPSFQPLKVGDSEIIIQIKNIIAYALDCIVDEDVNTVKNICAAPSSVNGHTHFPSDFLSTTVSSKRNITSTDIENATRIFGSIIGLSRVDYQNILNCLVAYNASIRLLSDDVSLAYSMLIYCLESLSQKYDKYTPVWDDYNGDLRNLLNEVFGDIDQPNVDRIKEILIKDSHLKLTQRFRNFATSNIGTDFFVNIPNRHTISKDDFDFALNNAYAMRSKYAHMLVPIMQQLTNGEYSRSHDIIEFQHNVFFTYSGLSRLVKKVLLNFINSRPQVETEKINWTSQLPGYIEAEWAPHFWINKDDVKCRFPQQKFEGFIECLTHFRDHIPNMDSLVLYYLNHLPEMSPDNRAAAMSLCYIYSIIISNIEPVAKESMLHLIKHNQSLLNECNIYNIVAALFKFGGHETVVWQTQELQEAIINYRERKHKANKLKLPTLFELLLYTLLANSYKDDNDSVQQQHWLSIAYDNANNFGEIQNSLERCITSGDLFELETIRCGIGL